MEERRNIFDYLTQIFCTFGITVVLLTILCQLFGEDAKQISGMFALGSEGIAVSTLGQYFMVAVLTTGARIFFFTDYVIKNKTLAFRMAGMMGTEIAIIVVFVCMFDWFPVNDWLPWVMFVLCFLGCAVVSTLIVAWKEKLENKSMEEALERLKKEGVE